MAERERLATDSVFRVAPRNILGLQAQKFKSKLLALALAEPATYFKLRDQVYQSIVETNVEVSYNLYWDILTKGEVNGDQISVEDKDGNEFAFTPNLPESEVNTFALEVAEAVKDIAERAVERVMPMEYKDLAVRRAKEILPNV
jgi:hypothetical protein